MRCQSLCTCFIRLWVKTSHVSEFPGDLFKKYEEEGAKNPRYCQDILEAIKIVNAYLHKKCSDDSLQPLTYFFPGEGTLFIYLVKWCFRLRFYPPVIFGWNNWDIIFSRYWLKQQAPPQEKCVMFCHFYNMLVLGCM